ncbi:AAA family ATPase [Maricurvus nonylphenolicus]|uniref:SPOR domain-containing protein n=1 Tax=Maricurvus nonylphenolicus TaxID=1008307 RepID=UPI0036F4158D
MTSGVEVSLSAAVGPEKIADYLGHYGLLTEPFNVDAEVVARGGFYTGAQRQQILDQLVHLSQFSSGVLLVLGEAGCGKSALLQACQAQVGDDRLVCSIEAGVLDDQQVLFGQIAEVLELPFQHSAGQQLAAIRSHCQDEESADLLVLIDDADHLDDPILSGLLSLLQGVDQGRSGLHLVLVGGVDLAARIDAFQMLDVAVHDLSLPALTSDELGDYLECRMRAAGLAGDMPFSLKDIEQFWQLSLGLPGAVNKLAHQFLVNHAGEVNQSQQRSLGLPFGHMAAVVVLGAALIMAVVYRYDGTAEQQVSVPEKAVSLTPLAPKAVIQGAETEVVKEAEPIAEPLFSAPIPEQLSSHVEAELPKQAFDMPGPESFADEEDIKPLPDPSLQTQVDLDADVAVMNDVAADIVEAPVWMPSAPPSLEEQVEAEVLPPLENAAPAAGMALADDEAFLLQQDETGYVLQVLAAGSEQAIKAFVGRQSNKGDLKVFEARRNGKPWYVVVVGIYANKADARRAIGRLPAEQQKSGPWPRSVLSVQAEIGEVRDI